jgi:CTD small phosphatase-like protein 2
MTDEEEDEDEDEGLDPLVFISRLPPLGHCVSAQRSTLLPRKTRGCKQKTLVLDLDETLVHSTLDVTQSAGADFQFPVFFNGAEHQVRGAGRGWVREGVREAFT